MGLHPEPTMKPLIRLSWAYLAWGLCSLPAQAQTSQELLTELRQLRNEVQQLKTELTQLKNTPAPTPAAPSTPPSPVARVAPTPETAPAPSRDAVEPRVNLFGYGEMYYTRPKRSTADNTAMATARRGVLGFAYRFNDKTRFAAELEIENAVVSAGDQGEVAFEQLYVEHDLNPDLTLKAGLFLLPLGYLNETHEPTRYMGVMRNQVETAIIPSTWREMGLGLQGRTESGWRWNTGIVTSFDLNRWPTDADGRSETQASPLGAIHQEGQLANATSLATYGALNYDGQPGLNLGGGLFQGGVGQKRPDSSFSNARLSLYEWHAKWQYRRWELSGVSALGQFNGVDAFNASGIANPVPKQFKGWYAQAVYRAWQNGEQSLVPFVRYERLNTAQGYPGLPQGLAPTTEPDTRTLTAGLSFYLHPQVVLKADLQRFLNNSALDRFNLGLGFHY